MPVPRAAEAQLTHEEALLVLKLAVPQHAAGPGGGGGAAPAALSARQIFEREATASPIITFVPELDTMMGGGVETGAITEFWWVLRCAALRCSALRGLGAGAQWTARVAVLWCAGCPVVCWLCCGVLAVLERSGQFRRGSLCHPASPPHPPGSGVPGVG